MENKWVGVVYYVVILSSLYVTRAFREFDDISRDPDKPKVQVRSVFVNCQPDGAATVSENDKSRFEQHELYKHNALKNCVKKLALTVKITSESDSSGDEYLPIEHVFEGSNQQRFRLLDPYVLRLQRDLPLQAYKLQKLEIVSGVLMDYPEKNDVMGRVQRDIKVLKESEPEIPSLKSSSDSQVLQGLVTTTVLNTLNDCDKNQICLSQNKMNERYKRNDRNIIVEGDIESDAKWIATEHSQRDRMKYTNDFDNDIKIQQDIDYAPLRTNNKIENLVKERSFTKNIQRIHRPILRSTTVPKLKDHSEYEDKPTGSVFRNNRKGKGVKNVEIENDGVNQGQNTKEKPYAIYEIGPPQVWYNVHLQLFEKMSTPDGRTLWNDLTKGSIASVSSLLPEWSGPDVNVRYRSTRWVPREEFTLPTNRLCLLVSTPDETNAMDNITTEVLENIDYIVLPEEDIMDFKDLKEDIKKNADNISKSELDLEGNAHNNSDVAEQKYRKVAIRLTRSILKNDEDKPSIASAGDGKYLTLVHRRPHAAQIDVEVRADENEVVRVGSSGRISIAVADSTRRTRTILNLQVGNTGLAAANFRVVARDFDPLLSDLMKDKEVTIAGPLLIPPRHTRSVHLELPVELPVDLAHCSVTLLNDQDKSVALRDVAIKKGDRCFCVWHCECVCLSDDPRLICRDMDDAGMSAAGLTLSDRPRHIRSIAYCDVATLNMFVMFIGVIIALLFMGLMKATVGLVCRKIGTCGLPQLLQTPRKLNQYYECSLKNRPVVYDDENWPVHPDTKERTVRCVSLPIEFMLNTIFFVCLPIILLYEGIKKLICYCTNKKTTNQTGTSPPTCDKKNKEVYSTHDMQAVLPRRRRFRDGLRKWMTPQAQKLSAELWQKSRNAQPLNNDTMQPLLLGNRSRDGVSNVTHDFSADSEQDDTDYVLTQMQKSRESLARSHQKMMDLEPSGLPSSPSRDYQ